MSEFPKQAHIIFIVNIDKQLQIPQPSHRLEAPHRSFGHLACRYHKAFNLVQLAEFINVGVVEQWTSGDPKPPQRGQPSQDGPAPWRYREGQGQRVEAFKALHINESTIRQIVPSEHQVLKIRHAAQHGEIGFRDIGALNHYFGRSTGVATTFWQDHGASYPCREGLLSVRVRGGIRSLSAADADHLRGSASLQDPLDDARTQEKREVKAVLRSGCRRTSRPLAIVAHLKWAALR